MALPALIDTLPPAPVPTPTVPPLSPATRPPASTETWFPASSVTSPPWPPPKVLVDTTLSCPDTVIESPALIDTLPVDEEETGEETASQEGQYAFAGFDIEFSHKVVLTPLTP